MARRMSPRSRPARPCRADRSAPLSPCRWRPQQPRSPALDFRGAHGPPGFRHRAIRRRRHRTPLPMSWERGRAGTRTDGFSLWPFHVRDVSTRGSQAAARSKAECDEVARSDPFPPVLRTRWIRSFLERDFEPANALSTAETSGHGCPMRGSRGLDGPPGQHARQPLGFPRSSLRCRESVLEAGVRGVALECKSFRRSGTRYGMRDRLCDVLPANVVPGMNGVKLGKPSTSSTCRWSFRLSRRPSQRRRRILATPGEDS